MKKLTILQIIIAISFLLFMIYQSFGLEFGLRKPKFRAGTCVSNTYGDEFYKKTYYKYIAEIGDKEYRVLPILGGYAQTSFGAGVSIKEIDKDFTEVDCESIPEGEK